MVATQIRTIFNFPAPAIGAPMIERKDKQDDNNAGTSRMKLNVTTIENENHDKNIKPGTLPEGAGEISNAARSLLFRLLDPDPKVRLKSLRQLHQTAFYMGFNFEHVKAKKVSPKVMLEHLIPTNSENFERSSGQEFESFEQFKIPL